MIQGCVNAEAAWEKYHNTIEGIIDAFEGQRGLLLDFHGQVIKLTKQKNLNVDNISQFCWIGKDCDSLRMM